MNYTNALSAEEILRLASHNELEITSEKLYEALVKVEKYGYNNAVKYSECANTEELNGH